MDGSNGRYGRKEGKKEKGLAGKMEEAMDQAERVVEKGRKMEYVDGEKES